MRALTVVPGRAGSGVLGNANAKSDGGLYLVDAAPALPHEPGQSLVEVPH